MRFKSFRERFLFPFTAVAGAVFLSLASGTAQAACTDPDGEAGDMIYNADHDVMQWCDGTNWYAAGGGGSGGGGGGDVSGCIPGVQNFDSVEVGSGETSYTLSGYTVNNTGNGQILVVITAAENTAGGAPSGATFDGQAMTELRVESGNGAKSAMYYLANPPAATGDVVVSYSDGGSFRAGVGAITLDCVDTSAAPQVTGSGVNGTSISNSITPADDASIILDIMANGTGSSMPSEDGDADTTHVAQDIAGSANSSWGISSLVQGTAANATFGWSVPSNPTSQILAAFAPSADATGTGVSSLSGSSLWSDNGGNIHYSGGNVGIGTSSPGQGLEVHKDTVKFATSDNDAHTWFPYSDGQVYITGDEDGSGTGDIVFRSYSEAESYDHHVTIKGNTGNVGIGTANPGSTLTVAGQIHSTTGGIRFPDNTVQTTRGVPAPPVCTGNDKALQWNGSNWSCKTISGGGGGGIPTCKSDMSNIQIGDTCDDGSKFLGSHPNFGWQGFYVTDTNQSTNSNWSNAVNLCNNLNRHGHTDWYLPALMELRLLYENKDAIGGFTTSVYWSSTEYNSVAWNQYFDDGFQGNGIENHNGQDSTSKNNSGDVRCVRRD